MRNQQQIRRNKDLYAALEYGCNQLDILEESNRFLIDKLRAGDLTDLPALVVQRNLLESKLIKFNKNLFNLLPDNNGQTVKKVDESVLSVAKKIREKALHLSESYLALFEIIEDGQKNILQRLKDIRLSSKMFESYHTNSIASSRNQFARLNKGKESQ